MAHASSCNESGTDVKGPLWVFDGRCQDGRCPGHCGCCGLAPRPFPVRAGEGPRGPASVRGWGAARGGYAHVWKPDRQPECQGCLSSFCCPLVFHSRDRLGDGWVLGVARGLSIQQPLHACSSPYSGSEQTVQCTCNRGIPDKRGALGVRARKLGSLSSESSRVWPHRSSTPCIWGNQD